MFEFPLLRSYHPFFARLVREPRDILLTARLGVDPSSGLFATLFNLGSKQMGNPFSCRSGCQRRMFWPQVFTHAMG